MPIEAVVFDVGETLIDETRAWDGWADWLGVPRFTFHAVLGAVIARGEHHRRVFEILAPGLDLAAAEAERNAAGRGYRLEPVDLYPDATAALAAVRASGRRVGLAGNQPRDAEAALAACGLAVDHIASSAGWGVEKPSPAFFERIVEMVGRPPGRIAYVGDRLDNDVLPALAAGLHSVFIVRGPWGVLHASRPEAARASATIRSLTGLTEVLDRLG